MIRLHTGRLVDPFNLENETFTAKEFIHPLALINRYTGHTKFPFSVAQHSVLLSKAVEVEDAGLARCAVIHDFVEGLFNDLAYPVKAKLPEYCEYEEKAQIHLFKVFNEPYENLARLKQFDRRICVDEMSVLFENNSDMLNYERLNVPILPWTWELAKRYLEIRCNELRVPL